MQKGPFHAFNFTPTWTGERKDTPQGGPPRLTSSDRQLELNVCFAMWQLGYEWKLWYHRYLKWLLNGWLFSQAWYIILINFVIIIIIVYNQFWPIPIWPGSILRGSWRCASGSAWIGTLAGSKAVRSQKIMQAGRHLRGLAAATWYCQRAFFLQSWLCHSKISNHSNEPVLFLPRAPGQRHQRRSCQKGSRCLLTNLGSGRG